MASQPQDDTGDNRVSYPIVVLLIDPDEDVRHWLGCLINRTQGFCCVGAYASLTELAEETFEDQLDLVLVDTKIAAHGLIKWLENNPRFSGTKFIITALEDGACYERLAKRVGAAGFLSKSRAPEYLAELKAKHRGGVSNESRMPGVE